jgi:hypothetical protein
MLRGERVAQIHTLGGMVVEQCASAVSGTCDGGANVYVGGQ